MHSIWRSTVQHSQQRSTRTATEASRSSSDPLEPDTLVVDSELSDSLASYTRDPFDHSLEGRSVDEIIAATPLLDVPNVRRWFELFQAGLPHSLYTYQLPLAQAAGP